MNTNRLTQFVGVAGNISQLIIASTIVCDLYCRLRDRNKVTQPINTPDDDDSDLSPSHDTTTNAAA